MINPNKHRDKLVGIANLFLEGDMTINEYTKRNMEVITDFINEVTNEVNSMDRYVKRMGASKK